MTHPICLPTASCLSRPSLSTRSWRRSSAERRRAFTLIELLVIIAILLSAIIAVLLGASSRGEGLRRAAQRILVARSNNVEDARQLIFSVGANWEESVYLVAPFIDTNGDGWITKEEAMVPGSVEPGEATLSSIPVTALLAKPFDVADLRMMVEETPGLPPGVKNQLVAVLRNPNEKIALNNYQRQCDQQRLCMDPVTYRVFKVAGYIVEGIIGVL